MTPLVSFGSSFFCLRRRKPTLAQLAGRSFVSVLFLLGLFLFGLFVPLFVIF